jgi:glycosyltransferase involved in cell wall biosynthesis
VCEPTADSIAAAMQRLADDRALAAAMGAKGLERASRITWEAVADCLLREPARKAGAKAARHKLLLTCTFSIFPPRHGGQSRIFHLFRALAPEFETVIVSLGRAGEPPFDGEIAPGVREVRVPISAEHARREGALHAKVGTPVTDVAMPELHHLTPQLHQALQREAKDACVAIASHPYLYPALQPLGLPIWYEEQDVEIKLKTALFQDLPGGRRLIEAVAAVERATVEAAELILCASPDDADQLVDLYGVDRGRIVEAPNGTDARRILFASPDERAELKARLGFADTPLAFFMGSGHWPNIEAVKRIFEFAAELPHVAFAVVGSVCYAFDPTFKPGNVLFLGEVDDITRNVCLQAADVALNPVEHGSGTNLKMLDYFAAGVPVVTTEEGSRGLRLDGERQCLVRGIEAFAAAIEEIVAEGAAAAAVRALAARELVENEFDWEAIAARIKPRLLQAAAGTKRAAPAGMARLA